MAFDCAKNVFLKSPVRRAIGPIRHFVSTPPIFIEKTTGKIRGKVAVRAIRQRVPKEAIGALSICHFFCVSRETNNAAVVLVTVVSKALGRFRQTFVWTRAEFFVDNTTSLLKQSRVGVAGADHHKCQTD